MHLWTEYEGNTLAGYPIGRLSRSEGRSAFFLTTTADGQPALLRLTEPHFDEGELIGRWRKAAAVSHPGLQAIWHSGQTTFDNVALACCLLEATDASLSDVLRERVLSPEETTEVAEAVAGALAALHAAGLVHEHVDATNVFAVGEAVKLRSDCVRECTGDFEADTEEAREALRQRDVHDLGLLIRRCLTPQWQEAATTPLPAPFDRIVRRALNGSVTAQAIVGDLEALKPPVAKIAEKLAPAAVPTPVPARAHSVEAAQPVRAARAHENALGKADPVASMRRKFVPGMQGADSEALLTATERDVLDGTSSPSAVMEALTGKAATGERSRPRTKAAADTQLHLPVTASADPTLEANLLKLRNKKRYDAGTAAHGGGMLPSVGAVAAKLGEYKLWLASCGAAAVLGLGLWHMLGRTEATPASAASVPIVNGPAAAASLPANAVATPSSAVSASTANVAAAHSARTAPAGTTSAGDWRVIAYTYRYEKQAQAKVEQLKQRYMAMQPEVFSPTGRAPYFVALGQPSDSASAIALRNRARHAGLPRDTYARNF